MKNRLFAVLAALVMCLGMAAAVAPPANAAGVWSGQRCKADASNYYKVCTQVLLDSGYVTSIQLCAYHNNDPGNHFRGTKDSTWRIFGSAGALKGSGNMNDANSGDCDYTIVNANVGNGACYQIYGTIDIAVYFDTNYLVTGKVSGGAC